MGSTVSVNSYTHSVTYVTDQMLNSLKRIITLIGLDPAKFVNQWSIYEIGIKTWLQSQHLKTAVLEVTSSTGALVTRWDFTIDYGYGSGDGTMWVDTDMVRFAILKLGVIPSTCNYEVKITLAPGAATVAGWYDCSFLSTAGFIKQNLGTNIGTNSIGTQSGYWRKES